MATKKLSTAKQLKSQLLNFIDDIIEICPDDYQLPIIRAVVCGAVDETEIIESFIKHVLPYQAQIKSRDANFFETNDHIFGPLPQDKVKHFRSLWFSGHFDNQDKQVIWDYFSVFIDLCKRY